MSIVLPLFSLALLLSFILSLVTLSLGSVSTATIDDEAGDSITGAQPVYSPANAFTLNSNCDGCTVQADPGQAFDRSWHDSSQLPGGPAVSVTLSFTGIGIDVFCILANTIGQTDLAFTLDGSAQAPYSHTADPTVGDYVYNAQVFTVGGLAQAAHELVVTTNNPSGSLLLFDYARYRSVLLSSRPLIQC
ncbi:hypothetical protein DFH06DRAFT_998917 [Mycena polygramma]|nr:hypothetical protein DFH06DRAFT_998917 [Mycena polygramma]